MNNKSKINGQAEMLELEMITKNDLFYRNFLLASGVDLGKMRVSKVANVMCVLEQEFRVQENGFAKHFGKNVSDQEKLFGYSWEIITSVSRNTFTEAFNKIGATYCGYDNFEKAKAKNELKFQDSFYYRVKTPYKNRTFYYRNELAKLLFDDYQASLENSAEESTNQELSLEK